MNEFDDVIRLLHDGRPQATELELDQIKQRARRQAAKHPSSGRNQSMKSRIAVVAMVGLGMLFSTAGTGLAVSGIASSSDNASVAQYGTPGGTPTPDGGVAGDHDQSGGTNGGGDENGAGNGGNGPDGGVLPAEDTAPDSTTADTTQSARQVEATTSSSQLPFTGFAAIPVMLGGIALLSGGLVLRRRTRAE